MKASERYDWIIQYLLTHAEASAVNQDFQDAYHKRFPGYERRETLWGAEPVRQACRDLSALYRQGRVVRRNVGLVAAEPGFPRWVACYSLS